MLYRSLESIRAFSVRWGIARLETNGWSKYSPFQKFGYVILEEMEKFEQLKIFTIPSMGKPSLWNRILGR
jgi:hypothetical protein